MEMRSSAKAGRGTASTIPPEPRILASARPLAEKLLLRAP